MSSKDKAINLFQKFIYVEDLGFSLSDVLARKCATIVVDELIKELNNMNDPEYIYCFPENEGEEGMNGYEKIDFYKEVKQEIEKL